MRAFGDPRAELQTVFGLESYQCGKFKRPSMSFGIMAPSTEPERAIVQFTSGNMNGPRTSEKFKFGLFDPRWPVLKSRVAITREAGKHHLPI